MDGASCDAGGERRQQQTRTGHFPRRWPSRRVGEALRGQQVPTVPCHGRTAGSAVGRPTMRAPRRPRSQCTWNRPRQPLDLRDQDGRAAKRQSDRAVLSARLSTISGNVTADAHADLQARPIVPLTGGYAQIAMQQAGQPVRHIACGERPVRAPSPCAATAIRAAVAFVPAMTAATSPGSTRNATKNQYRTIPSAPPRTAASRLATNLMDHSVPCVILPWRSAIAAVPSG